MTVKIGYNGGITGPNAALTVHMDWEKCLKKFLVICEPDGQGQNRLLALVPTSEGDGQRIAELIVTALDGRGSGTGGTKS